MVADDSGLEVDALGGAPGVRSARFAADTGLVDSPDANDNTDVWNNILLLQKMEEFPTELRTARYHCTLVAARDGEVVQVADGTVEGVILDAPRGTGGFGYDPLFYLPDLGKTMAEIDLETKLSLSHRGRAIAALLQLLARLRFTASHSRLKIRKPRSAALTDIASASNNACEPKREFPSLNIGLHGPKLLRPAPAPLRS